MRKFFVIGACLLLVFGLYLSYSTVDTSTPTADAKSAKTYTGTVYIAGMGGHFAEAKISIDPSNMEAPITMTSLDRVVIGDKGSYPTHDARIDAADRTKMFWSTYKPDKAMGGKAVHVGRTDLTTKKVLDDKAAQIDPRAKWTGALYCASAQTKDSYIPFTMTDEGYIDVFDKATLNLKHRVFLDYKPGESKFYHGSNSSDFKKIVAVVNLADGGKPNGKIDVMLLDAKKLENGTAKVLKKTTVSGKAGKTLTFRSSFTPNGKYILQSANDRFLLFKASNLKLLDEEIMGDKGGNHDAISTPDGKYAVLTVRTKKEVALEPTGSGTAKITDGELLLYDIGARKVVGNSVSVCVACHQDMGIKGNATLCGADANWN